VLFVFNIRLISFQKIPKSGLKLPNSVTSNWTIHNVPRLLQDKRWSDPVSGCTRLMLSAVLEAIFQTVTATEFRDTPTGTLVTCPEKIKLELSYRVRSQLNLVSSDFCTTLYNTEKMVLTFTNSNHPVQHRQKLLSSYHRAFFRLFNYTHQHMHIYIYIYIYIYYLRSLKFTLKHLKRPTCFDHTIILREHDSSFKLASLIICVKVNQSRYRPGVAQRVPGS